MEIEVMRSRAGSGIIKLSVITRSCREFSAFKDIRDCGKKVVHSLNGLCGGHKIFQSWVDTHNSGGEVFLMMLTGRGLRLFLDIRCPKIDRWMI